MPWNIGSGMRRGPHRGVFFCAVVGERTFLRFVPANDVWEVTSDEHTIVREMGTCLRLIECEPDTPIWYPDSLQQVVYDFWDAAQNDILAEWMHETDPANLQPRVRPLNLRVADFIRAHPAVDIPEQEVNRALDILESPWPRREEIMLRRWFEDQDLDGAALSASLIKQITASGLEPVEPPQPLPPISSDEIQLLCWLGIEA